MDLQKYEMYILYVSMYFFTVQVHRQEEFGGMPTRRLSAPKAINLL